MNADISFFDGFDGKLVGIVYGSLILFSIVFQVVKTFYNKKKLKQEGYTGGSPTTSDNGSDDGRRASVRDNEDSYLPKT